ncbi:WS/DGAT/MGAT family O-acyltransferase [Antrihabitans stalactiti]|uniref:Diacylglycerol O-acyltransferase n=1 Tax=Antrihabitans stalactiti TaxID=2584121 RepID=A0A848KGN8_9NOCA|nr:wax ester/triacylglycerol synthase family O-acyltransferase [Antrihabitans stalactiti]NMN96254.1 wax ester/triacylglycerol synthase family O-acyltransferase [Antrihabitans stalactiti]
MALIAPIDASFLLMETREQPMHVGGLQIFQLPDGAGPDYVGDLYRRLLTYDTLRGLYRRRPSMPSNILGDLWWKDERDKDVDLEYHVRLSALPKPGRVRELLELVSRLHGTLLDRHRPLWEFHLIEGLEDNRFATYGKVHHALVDGIRGTQESAGQYSPDPAAELPPMWAPRDKPASARTKAESSTERRAPWRAAAELVGDVAGVAPTLMKVFTDSISKDSAAVAFTAPKTMLNVSLTGARRFAAQSWPIDRIKKVAKANGATINDVVLAMCSGALRRYLVANDALPTKSLIAAVPVALPVADTSREGGNAVTMVLSRLATEIADPLERLTAIRASMLTAKESMAGRSTLQINAVGMATTIVPTGLNLIPGYVAYGRTPYNLVISNVPGPREPLYWNGARLLGWYPVSVPTEGLALNMTVLSYADNMEFGLTGCRRSVPHLQHLLDYLEDSLAELEQ